MKKNIVKKNYIKKNIHPPESNYGKLAKDYIWLALIVIFTLILFSGTLKNKFVNWDDDTYIHKNTSIQQLNVENLKKICTEPYFANYHPLTSLSYALEYHFFKLNPYAYHLTNLILHLFNIILVFIFVRKLTDKKIIPLVASFLFAVHPMHVESVAWISERKDMLYTFFYLSSLIIYLRFLKENKPLLYVFSFFLFLFSLMSKSAAVSLPLILIFLSFFINNKLVFKDFVRSIPFFALSLVFGMITLFAQNDAIHIININELYHPFERILLIFFAIHFYISRFVFPFGFSAVHAFPDKEIAPFPVEFYISPIIVLVLILIIIMSKGEIKKYLIFGFFFFLFNIILVIQIIPVGDSVVSERYTYVSYIGLSLIFAYITEKYLIEKFKILTIFIFTIYFFYLSVATYNQIKTWENSETLWTNAIEKNPKCFLSHYSRGAARAELGLYDKALEDFNNSIKIYPKYAMAFSNRGVIKVDYGDIQGAIEDYDKAILLNSNYAKSFNNRGHAYALNNEMDKALSDFNKAISLDSNYFEAYSNRGNVYQLQGKSENALNDYAKAIKINPTYIKAYENTATLFFNNGEYLKAIAYYTNVIQLNPNHNVAYYFRGLSKQRLNDIKNACDDWKLASDLGNTSAQNMLNTFCN